MKIFHLPLMGYRVQLLYVIAVVTTTIRLRYDDRSIKVIKVTLNTFVLADTLAAVNAVKLTYLFI